MRLGMRFWKKFRNERKEEAGTKNPGLVFSLEIPLNT